MVGMGIASFVDGMVRGYGIRGDWEDRAEARKDRERDRAWQDTQRSWAEEDRAYSQDERRREREGRDAIRDISAEARTQYDADVAAGKQAPGDFDRFWKQFAIPRMQNEMLQRGDVDGYTRLTEWAESQDAVEGGRLFAGAMFKANTGDFGGALDDVIKAGKLRGYIAGDFDIDEKEEIKDPDGNLLGYRITIRDDDGDETVQDIALEDVPTIISTFANPQAAWESQQASRAASRKREQDLEDYRSRKEIDRENDTKPRENAIKALRERLPTDETLGQQGFDTLPRAEQEKLIADEITLQRGGVASPAAMPVPSGKTIVDTMSGQPVDIGTMQAAPGLGQVPAARVPAPQMPPGQGVGATPPAQQRNAVINGAEDPGLAAPPTQSQLIDQAARQMVEGGNPQDIARTLRASGVDESAWPPSLVRLLTQTAPQ